MYYICVVNRVKIDDMNDLFDGMIWYDMRRDMIWLWLWYMRYRIFKNLCMTCRYVLQSINDIMHKHTVDCIDKYMYIYSHILFDHVCASNANVNKIWVALPDYTTILRVLAPVWVLGFLALQFPNAKVPGLHLSMTYLSVFQIFRNTIIPAKKLSWRHPGFCNCFSTKGWNLSINFLLFLAAGATGCWDDSISGATKHREMEDVRSNLWVVGLPPTRVVKSKILRPKKAWIMHLICTSSCKSEA